MRLTIALSLLFMTVSARAEVKTREVEYKVGGKSYQGFFAWDDAQKLKRPGVLIVHEWWGHNEHARNQAKRLAKAGYVAFALDMFGKGKLAEHPKDAQGFVAEVMKEPGAATARFDAGLAELKKDTHVDPAKLAAIGYCFGGGIVLGAVRQGADLQAAATFHGDLSNHGAPVKKGAIKPRILVMTGGDDQMIPAAAVDAFKKEMTDAGARFSVVTYPGAKHGFTNPDAGKHGVPALGYDADADKKSFAELLKFFKEVFGS